MFYKFANGCSSSFFFDIITVITILFQFTTFLLLMSVLFLLQSQKLKRS